jgi:16S rRNA (cytosine1402-N4)-methyltransferase
MESLLADVGITAIDGVALDLGVSSMQIDNPGRGFSFRRDGPLDMRMGAAQETEVTAAHVINKLAEGELADIIYQYGEERASRKIARAIVALRKKTPITRTVQLAEIVRHVVKRSGDGIDPATRTFQALRIYVNDELGELERGLRAAENLLVPGGRLAVVSFHSLEDQRVKTFLRDHSGRGPRPSRHHPAVDDTADGTVDGMAAAMFRLHGKTVLRPGADEIRHNPRARSARLRWAERTATAAIRASVGGPS